MKKNKITTKKIYTKLRGILLDLPGIKQVVRFIYDTYEKRANSSLEKTRTHTATKGWSVVITSDGKNPDSLVYCLRSIENELKNSSYEIIIVGPKNISPFLTSPHIKLLEYKELPFALAPGWITFKKNIGVRSAKYDKVVLSHDYVAFKPGWKTGFDLFGDSFDVCINKVSNPDQSRHRDWLVWDYPGIGATYLPYDFECTSYQYLSGTYFIAKRDFYMKYPLDEKLRWGEGEDVVWSKEIRQHTIFKFNPHSEVVYTKMKTDPSDWEKKSKELERILKHQNERR